MDAAQRRPPERFRGALFGDRVCLTSPFEHGSDSFFVLPTSHRLMALEPRRVICIHRPFLCRFGVRSLGWVSFVSRHRPSLISPVPCRPSSPMNLSRPLSSRSPNPVSWFALSYPLPGCRLHPHDSTVSLSRLLSSIPVSHHSLLLVGIQLSCARICTPNHNLCSNLGWDRSQSRVDILQRPQVRRERQVDVFPTKIQHPVGYF